MGEIVGEDKVIELAKFQNRPARILYDFISQPSREQWAEIKDDYVAARGKCYDGMTLDLLRRKQEQRLVGVYQVMAVFSDQTVERWGSFALELLEGDGEEMAPRITFVYLRLRPGTITQGIVDTIINVAQQIGRRVGASHILVQGRRGWEGLLAKHNAREITRIWLVGVD